VWAQFSLVSSWAAGGIQAHVLGVKSNLDWKALERRVIKYTLHSPKVILQHASSQVMGRLEELIIHNARNMDVDTICIHSGGWVLVNEVAGGIARSHHLGLVVSMV